MLAIHPVTHVVPSGSQSPHASTTYSRAQFKAWELLAGRSHPELGGGPDMLDVLGENY